MKFGLCSALHYISPGKWVPQVLVPFLASGVHIVSPFHQPVKPMAGGPVGGGPRGRKFIFIVLIQMLFKSGAASRRQLQ